MRNSILFLFIIISGCTCLSTKPPELLINNLSQNEIDKNSYDRIINSLKDGDSKNFSSLNLSALDPVSVANILDYEYNLLKNWIPLEGYVRPSESTIGKDAEEIVIRCGTVDDAPLSAPRVPTKKTEDQNRFLLTSNSEINIPVHVHIINNSQGYIAYDTTATNPKLKVTKDVIEEQFRILDSTFNQHNIHFTLESIDSINNRRWNESGMRGYNRNIASAMVKKLNKDPLTHLNVYIIDGRKSGKFLIGEATFPWDQDTPSLMDHHVVISCRSLPNFYDVSFNETGEGKTLIHEVGHYLGLWHTFQGSSGDCDDANNNGCEIGDRVADTAPQNICHRGACGCSPITCNTCEGDNLRDPISNFMSYSNDECMNQFTDGQIERLIRSTLAERKHYVTVNVNGWKLPS